MEGKMTDAHTVKLLVASLKEAARARADSSWTASCVLKDLALAIEKTAVQLGYKVID